MKTRKLLITLSVAALATVNALSADALLSPRAADHQVKIQPVSNDDPILTSGLASSSPRLLDNQTKTVAGKSATVTPSLQCTRHMSGTPKDISSCADHPGASMPCCSVAAGK